jgi:hypothetical protein
VVWNKIYLAMLHRNSINSLRMTGSLLHLLFMDYIGGIAQGRNETQERKEESDLYLSGATDQML